MHPEAAVLLDLVAKNRRFRLTLFKRSFSQGVDALIVAETAVKDGSEVYLLSIGICPDRICRRSEDREGDQPPWQVHGWKIVLVLPEVFRITPKERLGALTDLAQRIAIGACDHRLVRADTGFEEGLEEAVLVDLGVASEIDIALPVDLFLCGI